jgi:hypothetical protein
MYDVGDCGGDVLDGLPGGSVENIRLIAIGRHYIIILAYEKNTDLILAAKSNALSMFDANELLLYRVSSLSPT